MFSKILKTFGVKFFSAVMNFLIAVVISQFMGAGGKGEQGIIITTITLILLFSNIAGGASLVYLTPRLPVKKILLLSYAWTLSISLIFIFILLLFPLVEQKYIIHIAILSCINSFTSINSSVLLGKQNIKATNLIAFSQVFSTLMTLMFFFVLIDLRNAYAYIFSLYTAFGIAYLVSIRFLMPYLNASNQSPNESYLQAAKMMLRYGFVNQLSHIAQLMSFRISYYFLDFYHGYKSVGIYSNGVSITESVWMISSSMALVQYSKIVNTNDPKANQKLTADLVRIGLLVTFLVLIPMVLLPSSFYSFIFGKEFYDINRIIWCLAPGMLIYVNSLIIGHYFSGTGKYHINSIGSAIGLVVTLICALLLIPHYSYMGSAAAACASYTASSIFIIIYFCHSTGTKFLDLLPMPKNITEYIYLFKQIIIGKNK